MRARARARREWQEALVKDQDVPHLAVRVALLIDSAVDAETGTAKRSREWLAMTLGCSVRSVELSIAKLGDYLEVERRQVGFDATRDRAIHGGAGGVNSYRLKLDGRAKQASLTGAKQASLNGEEAAKQASLKPENLSEESFETGAKQASLSPLSKILPKGKERNPLRPSSVETTRVRPTDHRWTDLCDRNETERGTRPVAYVSRDDPEGLPGYCFPTAWVLDLESGALGTERAP